MTGPELERALFYWPRVVGSVEGEWQRGFAKSIQRQRNRKNWKPSKKQWDVMQGMLADVAPEDGLRLIE